MDALRKHLLDLLKGGRAYDTFDDIVAEFTPEERGMIPPGAERSAWQILEHMRIALVDILEFIENEDNSYVERVYPDEYWNESPLPNAEAWEKTIRGYLEGRKKLEKLIKDEKRDLFAPFPWGEGETLLREILLAMEHEAHHLGQLVELKRWVASRSRK
ncbi:MAG TPA: DinB family protein [Fimbriimonadales bacterium]|nr:DinB family protein [Fimbriimonadales bacterium]